MCSLIFIFSFISYEARASGLAETYVSFTDQPVCIYYNPAGLTKFHQKLLETVPTKIIKFNELGFFGYTQRIQKVGIGLALARLNDKENTKLFSLAYPISLISTGLTFGVGEENYYLILGTLIDIGLKEVPGKISLAGTINYPFYKSPLIQFGSSYKFGITNIILEISKKGAKPLTPHLAALFKIKELEIGCGWNGYHGFALLTGMDFGDVKTNLSWYKEQFRLSLLFKIGSIKEFEEEIAKLKEKKIKKEKETSRTYLTQGIYFYNQGNYQESLNSFDIALIWDPENDEAISWIERVEKECKKKEIDSCLAVAEEKCRKRDFIEAIAILERALKIDPKNIEILTLYDKAQREFGQQISASISTTLSLREKEKEIVGLFKEATDYYAKGDHIKTKKTLDKIEEIAPKEKVVKEFTQEIKNKLTQEIVEGIKKLERYEKGGNYKKALKLAERLHSLDPDNRIISKKIKNYREKLSEKAEILGREGVKYYNQGLYVKARSVFTELLGIEPDNKLAKEYISLIDQKFKKKDVDELYLAGVEVYIKGDYHRAIELWREVLRLDPNYTKAHHNIQRAKAKLEYLKD